MINWKRIICFIKHHDWTVLKIYTTEVTSYRCLRCNKKIVVHHAHNWILTLTPEMEPELEKLYMYHLFSNN